MATHLLKADPNNLPPRNRGKRAAYSESSLSVVDAFIASGYEAAEVTDPDLTPDLTPEAIRNRIQTALAYHKSVYRNKVRCTKRGNHIYLIRVKEAK